MRKLILLLAVMGGFNSSCSLVEKDSKHRYIFREQTGQNQFISLAGKEVAITFVNQSENLALEALEALKPEVLYQSSDSNNITVQGVFDEASLKFTLKAWAIEVPFVEMVVADETKVPHEIKVVERNELKRSDFIKSASFDPMDKAFDPVQHINKSGN